MADKKFSGKCKNCNAEIQNTGKGRPRIYCRPECRAYWPKAKRKPRVEWKCPQCGKQEKRRPNDKRAFCSRACYAEARKANRQYLKCEQCKKSFYRPNKGKDARKFCSRECAYKGKEVGGLKPKYGYHVKQWLDWLSKRPILVGPCCGCGTYIETKKTTKHPICASCINVRPYYLWRDVIAGRCETNCLVCGVLFSRIPGSNYRTCSQSCVKEMERRYKRKRRSLERAIRRKAVKGQKPFDPFDVFQRDGWRCRHCNTKTPKKLRGTGSMKSPELDHIVPLSKGGEHSERNTQLLCRQCNGKKSDGALYDQCRLF